MKICNRKLLLAALSFAALPLFGVGAAHGTVINLLGTDIGGSVNLCSGGSCPTDFVSINDAIFQVAPYNTGAGSGYGAFNSFLAVQAQGNNTEQRGYNSDYRNQNSPKTEFDEDNAVQQNRSVKVGELAPFSLNGTDYFRLILDIKEPSPNDKRTISLQELELYVAPESTNGAYTGYASGLGTLIWELDCNLIGPCGPQAKGTNNQINLDWGIHKGGSGEYDIIAYFPFSLLASFSYNDYFVLYNEFGKTDRVTPVPPGITGYETDSGFEEWAYDRRAIPSTGSTSSTGNTGSTGSTGGGGGGSAPEPGTLSLLGAALLGGLFSYRRRQRLAA